MARTCRDGHAREAPELAEAARARSVGAGAASGGLMRNCSRMRCGVVGLAGRCRSARLFYRARRPASMCGRQSSCSPLSALPPVSAGPITGTKRQEHGDYADAGRMASRAGICICAAAAISASPRSICGRVRERRKRPTLRAGLSSYQLEPTVSLDPGRRRLNVTQDHTGPLRASKTTPPERGIFARCDTCGDQLVIRSS